MNDCLSCGEVGDDDPDSRCPEARRPCGHHCNCAWEHEHCHWCNKTFGDEPDVARDHRLIDAAYEMNLHFVQTVVDYDRIIARADGLLDNVEPA